MKTKTTFNLGRDYLTLSIMTLITILTWVGFDVYRAATKTTITKATKEQMTPLDPKINREVINSLKSGLSLGEEEVNLEIIKTSTEAATPAE